MPMHTKMGELQENKSLIPSKAKDANSEPERRKANAYDSKT